MSAEGRGHVVVVGCGVIGAASAYYLSRQGWRVTMVDRGEFGAGCSHANCGYVCPSHVLPLAEPGTIGKTLKALVQPNSPFSIRPRLDWALWSWLLNFARRCNQRDMLAAGRGIQTLLDSSREKYAALIAAEQLDCEWETRGLYYVYRSAAELNAFAHTDEILSRHFQRPAERFDGEQLLAREPALNAGLAGAWFYEGDAHLRPDRLMSELRRVLEARGVMIRERQDLLGFDGNTRKAARARTSGGDLAADAFVVATGALTAKLGGMLGTSIPIEPGKGYSITMPRPKKCPTAPLIFPETRVAVTPMRSGYRLGSTMEFAGFDDSIQPARLKLLREGAKPYLQEPVAEPVLEEWSGWRPMTYDSLPIIDRSPKFANVWIAAGHNMLGLSMATGTGTLVAELVSGERPHLDPAPYSLMRF